MDSFERRVLSSQPFGRSQASPQSQPTRASFSGDVIRPLASSRAPSRLPSGVSFPNPAHDINILRSPGVGVPEACMSIADGRRRVPSVEDFPYRAIGYLRAQFPVRNLVTQGTGFLVGPNHVLTAAHNVYYHQLGQWAREVFFCPAKNDDREPYGTFSVSVLLVPKPYLDSENPNHFIHDYALLILDSPIGNKVGWFGLSKQLESSFTVTGYPGDKGGLPGNPTTGEQMWEMQGGPVRRDARTRPEVLDHNIDTYSGQSGSPVWSSRGHLALAIHARAGFNRPCNEATLITDTVYDQIIAWITEYTHVSNGEAHSPFNSVVARPKSLPTDTLSGVFRGLRALYDQVALPDVEWFNETLLSLSLPAFGLARKNHRSVAGGSKERQEGNSNARGGVDLSPSTRTTVLIGTNGLGKSFIINLLLFLTIVSQRVYENTPRIVRVLSSDTHNQAFVSSSIAAGREENDDRFLHLEAVQEKFGKRSRKRIVQEITPAEQEEYSGEEETKSEYENYTAVFEGLFEQPGIPTATMRAFLLPSENGHNVTTASLIRLRYGRTLHVLVRYEQLKALQLSAYARIEHGRDGNQKQREVLQRRWDQLTKDDPNKITQPEEINLHPWIKEVAGTTRIFTGNGKSLQADRLFVRKVIRELQGNRNTIAIKNFVVYAPCSVLSAGGDILDAPGTNDMDVIREDLTKQALAAADTVLVLVPRGFFAARDVIQLLQGSTIASRVKNDEARLVVARYPEKDNISAESLLKQEVKLEVIGNIAKELKIPPGKLQLFAVMPALFTSMMMNQVRSTRRKFLNMSQQDRNKVVDRTNGFTLLKLFDQVSLHTDEKLKKFIQPNGAIDVLRANLKARAEPIKLATIAKQMRPRFDPKNRNKFKPPRREATALQDRWLKALEDYITEYCESIKVGSPGELKQAARTGRLTLMASVIFGEDNGFLKFADLKRRLNNFLGTVKVDSLDFFCKIIDFPSELVNLLERINKTMVARFDVSGRFFESAEGFSDSSLTEAAVKFKRQAIKQQMIMDGTVWGAEKEGQLQKRVPLVINHFKRAWKAELMARAKSRVENLSQLIFYGRLPTGIFQQGMLLVWERLQDLDGKVRAGAEVSSEWYQKLDDWVAHAQSYQSHASEDLESRVLYTFFDRLNERPLGKDPLLKQIRSLEETVEPTTVEEFFCSKFVSGPQEPKAQKPQERKAQQKPQERKAQKLFSRAVIDDYLKAKSMMRTEGNGSSSSAGQKDQTTAQSLWRAISNQLSNTDAHADFVCRIVQDTVLQEQRRSADDSGKLSYNIQSDLKRGGFAFLPHCATAFNASVFVCVGGEKSPGFVRFDPTVAPEEEATDSDTETEDEDDERKPKKSKLTRHQTRELTALGKRTLLLAAFECGGGSLFFSSIKFSN